MPKNELEAELIICKKVDPVAKERFEFLLELLYFKSKSVLYDKSRS